MPPVHGIQPTFAGGEFAPSLAARVDLAKYATGARTLKNFFVHPHGGASNRPGTRYIATVKDSTQTVRVVAFVFSTVQAYVIEFGPGWCRFYMNGGQVQISTGNSPAWSNATAYSVSQYVTYSGVKYRAIQAGTNHQPDISPTYWTAQTTYEITNPYSAGELADLKFAQSADVLFICHPAHPPQQLIRSAHDSWAFSTYVPVGGPFMVSNSGTTAIQASGTTGSVTITATAALFNANHVGSLWRMIQDVPGNSISTSFSATGTSSSIKCGANSNWRIVTHGTWTGKLRVEQSIDNGGTWTELRTFASAADLNVNTFGQILDNSLVRLNMVTYTSGTVNVELTTDPYTQTGTFLVTGYADSTHVTATVQDTLGVAATNTAVWAEGSWSVTRGYPACCTFFQDRLAFGSTPAEPQTIWFTETANYTSFRRSDPLVDSDGISVNLPSRKMNAIRSLVPLKEILTLTSASEWTVGPGSDGILSPTSVQTAIDGYRGCNKAEPVIVGNRAIYVQPQGSVVRDLGYDFASSGFSGTDLSIISNHLFKNYSIVELAYQQEPDSLVWAVRSDGTLLSMTYLREQEVVAWTRHETQGTVESICTIPGATYDELWMVVKRGSSRFIEKMVQRLTSTDPRDQFFVDAGISYDSPVTISGATKANPVVITATAHGFSNGDLVDIRNVVGMTEINNIRFKVAGVTANTFQLKTTGGSNVNGTAYTTYVSGGEVRKAVSTLTGLDHLNGYTVTGLVDGNVMNSKVVSGGSITLDSPAALVHVGLGYTCDLETLNAELNLQDGTTQGRKVRVAWVTFRFLSSRGGFVGPNATDLHEIIQRTSEPLGSPVALYSGDYRIHITPSFEDGGRVFYRQNNPLPVTILAVMPKTEVGG